MQPVNILTTECQLKVKESNIYHYIVYQTLSIKFVSNQVIFVD